MARWKGIIGKSFSPAEFLAYLQTISWDEWRPEFIVLHHIEQLTAPGGLTEDYLRDMEQEYRNKGWSGGPHLFVDSERIWVFTPLTTPGVHANQWNGYTLGVEMEGNYDREEFNSGRGLMVQGMAVAAVAILSSVLGINPDSMMFHKENGRTDHNCPGDNVDKAQFIQEVKEYIRDNNL